jgi:hypothetical protein
MDKNIRKKALEWLQSKCGEVGREIFASKFYTPGESWSNSRVWFFQIPLEEIYSPISKDIHLLCENHLKGESFIHLKVKTLFLLKNLKSFDVDNKGKVLRIYLSAEAANMFMEVRGTGKVKFEEFIVR